MDLLLDFLCWTHKMFQVSDAFKETFRNLRSSKIEFFRIKIQESCIYWTWDCRLQSSSVWGPTAACDCGTRQLLTSGHVSHVRCVSNPGFLKNSPNTNIFFPFLNVFRQTENVDIMTEMTLFDALWIWRSRISWGTRKAS